MDKHRVQRKEKKTKYLMHIFALFSIFVRIFDVWLPRNVHRQKGIYEVKLGR